MAILGSARPIQSTLSIDKDFHRTYTSIYEVVTDDVTDGPSLVMTATGLPAWQSPYLWYNNFDDWAFCDGYASSFREVDKTRKLWRVTVTHTTPKPEQSAANTRGSGGGANPARREDPALEPPRLSGSFVQHSRPVTQDKDGNPLTNLNEEPFVPAIEIDDDRDTLIVEMNTPTISLSTRSRVKNRVNANAMWGLQPRQIKLNKWDYSIHTYGNQGRTYVRNQWEFHISYEEDKNGNLIGWTHEVLHEGYMEYTDTTNATTGARVYRPILIDDHRPTKPVKLDLSGFQVGVVTTVPHYLQFKIYKEADFSVLGIPDPLPGPFV